MEIKLILEKSKCGKSHTTHLKEAMLVVYHWIRAEYTQLKVVMGKKECELTLFCQEQLSKSQIANIAQAIADVCATNVRIPMRLKNGLLMEMRYQAVV